MRRLLLALALMPVAVQAQLPVAEPEIVATYPHDTQAFTEGLFYRDGALYESTGEEGRSQIRKVELTSGKVLERISLPAAIFGEGIVDWRDQIYSVIWHGGVGSRWPLNGFRRLGSFRYAGEGWGMTQDGKNIILSDGTPTLRFLDPRTMKVVRRLKVAAEGTAIANLNELEYVRGEILANIWQTNSIARIDPRTGAVKGWINVLALAKRAGASGPDAVPNGIAYDAKRDRLFLTGKNWPLLFEVRLPKAR